MLPATPPDALWGTPSCYNVQLQSVSGLEKKRNSVHSTDFKNALFYTSIPLSLKRDSSLTMVNTLPTKSTSLPAINFHGLQLHLLKTNEL
jgi:hypothetical protein